MPQSLDDSVAGPAWPLRSDVTVRAPVLGECCAKRSQEGREVSEEGKSRDTVVKTKRFTEPGAGERFSFPPPWSACIKNSTTSAPHV